MNKFYDKYNKILFNSSFKHDGASDGNSVQLGKPIGGWSDPRDHDLCKSFITITENQHQSKQQQKQQQHGQQKLPNRKIKVH